MAESAQVALIGMESSSDRAIWEFARENDFVIVTKDADLQELSLLNASPPKVIWLRLGNATNHEILEALVTNQAKLEDRIDQAGLDCIEIHRE